MRQPIIEYSYVQLLSYLYCMDVCMISSHSTVYLTITPMWRCKWSHHIEYCQHEGEVCVHCQHTKMDQTKGVERSCPHIIQVYRTWCISAKKWHRLWIHVELVHVSDQEVKNRLRRCEQSHQIWWWWIPIIHFSPHLLFESSEKVVWRKMVKKITDGILEVFIFNVSWLFTF